MTTDQALRQLMSWADLQVRALADVAQDAVLQRVVAYAKEEPVSRAELARSIQENLQFLITAMGRPDGAVLDLRTPTETGRRRALAAMPLPEVLRAYRIAFRTLWDALRTRVGDLNDPDMSAALLDAASRLWQLADEHAVALTESYRATTSEILLRDQRRRSALVEALFTGSAAAGSAWEAASLLGLPPDSDLVVIAAETTGLAVESLPNIDQILSSRGFPSAWRLMPALQLGIAAVPDGRSDELVEILRSTNRARTGVSPRYPSIAGTQRSFQLARAAIAMLPPGCPGVHVFSDSPLAAMMACDPDAAERLSHDVLGTVLAQPAEDRDILIATLHAYLDHAASAEQAGKALHCHPNTVRYRLRRVTDLTGRSFQNPLALSELAAASYAVRIRAERDARVARDE